jgi:hypothetical protein
MFDRLKGKLDACAWQDKLNGVDCAFGEVQAASKYADKLITFEYFTTMSPDAEWGSSGRLLERYIEALGLDRSTTSEVTTRMRAGLAYFISSMGRICLICRIVKIEICPGSRR